MTIQSLRIRSERLAAAALLLLVASACGRRNSLLEGAQPSSTAAARPSPSRSGGPTLAGMTCARRDDCPTDQLCVQNTCRFRETSVGGEILASAAAAQIAAGDWDGAMRTYDNAIERFEERRAPVPPSLLCASATLILRTATDAEARERGAKRADQCFRTSVPGAPEREDAQRAVARLRFEGLDVGLFDRDTPAERFFTQEASRPTIDAIAIDLAVPELNEPGAREIREALAGEAAHRAIADCFLQDWEQRHVRSARASVVVQYSVRMHDMGAYDTFEPSVTVEKTTLLEDGFEPCVAASLTTALEAPRVARGIEWHLNVEVSAEVQ